MIGYVTTRELALEEALAEVKRELDAYEFQDYWFVKKLRKIVEEALDESD